MKKIIIALIVAVIAISGFIYFKNISDRQESSLHPSPSALSPAFYTCGMHPSVKVSVEEYNKGSTLCPICNMKLIPVDKAADEPEDAYYGCSMKDCPHCDRDNPEAKCICGDHSFIMEGSEMNCPICGEHLKKLSGEEADRLHGVAGRVRIKEEEARLAGVATEEVARAHLYKSIRAVGKVAFDPALLVAQQEYISALEMLDKATMGRVEEVSKRANNLTESSRRKLILLGLSDQQIEDLAGTRDLQKSLILPEEKMWIYGDVYEYELGWVKVGSEVIVSSPGIPGEEFAGKISSLSPVLDPKTRSLRFRAEVDNAQMKLKPEMYVNIVIESMYMSPNGEHMVVAIPKDAILDTGARKIVWVDRGDGEYEGRLVVVGPEASAERDGVEVKYYPVFRGVSLGERVVTKANFLIDSQSQITGVAASGYSGALDAGDKPMPAGHQH